MEIKLQKNQSNKSRKRSARGISAGRGMTAGRGTKGQKARSGFNIPKRFEGGQTNLSMRLPKLRGFTSPHKKDVLVYIDDINKHYKDGEVISAENLVKNGLIKKGQTPKILNNGELKVSVTLDGVKTSKSMADKFGKSEKKEEKPKSAPKTEKKDKKETKVEKKEEKPKAEEKTPAKK